MYRTLLNWELASLATHVQALVETIRNDSLRKLWSSLFNAELDFYDKFLKYGKLKGWARVGPRYCDPGTYWDISYNDNVRHRTVYGLKQNFWLTPATNQSRVIFWPID
jgi:hypothetical protein